MKNKFREKIINGEKPIGTFFEMGNANVAEAFALTNLDYILIDTEHGPFDIESTLHLMRAVELHDMTAMIRVKDSSRTSILKMLDIGAGGLIIPQVKSVEEVKSIVEYGKYYPLGNRGVAFSRGAGFGYAEHAQEGIDAYFETCNRETLLIPQCETVECLENIEEIASIEGIDGIFVGPYDLSVAMGIPTQFDKPQFKEAMVRVLNAVKAAGKFTIIYCANEEIARQRFSQGFDSVTVNQDVNLYIDAINNMVKEIKK